MKTEKPVTPPPASVPRPWEDRTEPDLRSRLRDAIRSVELGTVDTMLGRPRPQNAS